MQLLSELQRQGFQGQKTQRGSQASESRPRPPVIPSEAAAYLGRRWQDTWKGWVLDLGNGAPTGSQIFLTLQSCHCAKSEVMTIMHYHEDAGLCQAGSPESSYL